MNRIKTGFRYFRLDIYQIFKPTTIKDIATSLGLSTSTVSRALRDSYEISEDTKKLVREYADELDYKATQLHLAYRAAEIVGFCNSEVVELLQHSSSYIRQPAFETGRVAAELLINLIEAKYPVTGFETRVLDNDLHLNENLLNPANRLISRT
ncbi:MAG TPA: LacI family DNA-binding transcriptional regulator [Sphingobacteriaceae bacterium]